MAQNLRYPFEQLSPSGTKKEVAPGVYWLRFALPFALDHINLWLLEDGDGWLLVDTGFDTPENRDWWLYLFATALDGKPIKRILVTHYHPDHLGLAHWVSEHWQAPVLMSRGEWQIADEIHAASDEYVKQYGGGFLAIHGAPLKQAAAITQGGNTFRRSVEAIPKVQRWLADGDTVSVGNDDWQVIVGTGHAPEHVCLYQADKQLFISGDQVLPTISSNLMVRHQLPEADPVTEFMDSQRKLCRLLPEEVLVLPAHGLPFYGLHDRANYLIEHHHQQLAVLFEACKQQALTAFQALPVLFKRKLDNHQMIFAMGESIAHLNHLWLQGKVQRQWHSEQECWSFA